MSSKEKIRLTKEQETLLIPLYSKAQEFPPGNPILIDPKAKEIMAAVEYDFAALKVKRGTFLTMFIRAKKFDDYTKDFISKHPDGVVLHLGCGLDSRCLRVDHPQANWFDLDLPDVIELRAKFYAQSERYHLIASSVTNLGWVDQIPVQNKPALVILEGLAMYLMETEIKALLLKLKSVFPNFHLAMDVFSVLTARSVGRNPSLKKTGATIHWGIDDAAELENWIAGFRLAEEWFFTQSEDIPKLGFGDRLMFKITGLFAMANKAHRIVYYKSESK